MERVEQSSRLIERLFARFAAVYGRSFAQAWAGADPEEMKRAWGQRLAKFDPHQVGRALEVCETSIRHPPTLPEFIDLVRSCFQPEGLALTYTRVQPVSGRSDAELIAAREYPKQKNGFGIFWAQQIVRMAQLGAFPHTYPLMCALKVLGIENIAQLADKYPPYADDPERAAIHQGDAIAA